MVLPAGNPINHNKNLPAVCVHLYNSNITIMGINNYSQNEFEEKEATSSNSDKLKHSGKGKSQVLGKNVIQFFNSVYIVLSCLLNT